MIRLQKGRYQPLELIGSGTTSRVEKARDNVIGRTVALKTFICSFEEDVEDQFLGEAQLVGQLSHPAIVQLYDVGINEQSTPFLVMEYIAGNTLEQRLAPFSLTVQRACTWAADLARALALAHRVGIIHGDIKPGNIFITPDEKVKLGDFGIARLATQVSGSDRLKGTPAYLAPEQIRGEPQDQRSDQFSFGIVFYQMLTGVRPFAGDSVGAVCAEILNGEVVPPSQHNPAVPQALDRVVARCLAKNPNDRFASFEELVRSLYPFTRSQPRPAASTKYSWWFQPAKHRDVWLFAATCLLVVGSLQIPRVLRSRYGDSPAPARLYFRPGVPYEASSYTRQTIAATQESDAPGDTPRPAKNSEIPPSMIRLGRIGLASLNRAGDTNEFPSNQSASFVHLSRTPTHN